MEAFQYIMVYPNVSLPSLILPIKCHPLCFSGNTWRPRVLPSQPSAKSVNENAFHFSACAQRQSIASTAQKIQVVPDVHGLEETESEETEHKKILDAPPRKLL